MTQDEMIELAKEADIWQSWLPDLIKEEKTMKSLEAFAKLVAAKEREACAKVCDEVYELWINKQGRYEFMAEGAGACASVIRARGEQA